MECGIHENSIFTNVLEHVSSDMKTSFLTIEVNKPAKEMKS